MRATIYGYKRKNNAFRVAYWTDCQRIHTAPNLKKITHGWANERIAALSSPASKILRFLAALNLTGQTGYAGFAVAYKLLAPLIGETTSSNLATRSMERGIHDLKKAGLVEVHPWLQENQFFKVGGRNIRMSGALRITLAGGGEVVRRLAIVTLTDLALSMWEAGKGKPPAKKGARKASSPPCPGTANLAERSPKTEQIDKSIMLGSNSRSVSLSESVNVSVTEGRSTRPTPPRTAPPTIEHGASTVPPSPPAPISAASPVTASSEARVCPPAAPKKRAKGCSKQRPDCRGPRTRDSRAIARDMILAGVWDMLANHSPRQADAAYSRAVWEIDQKGPAGWPNMVDWDYWLDRWENFSPPERRIKILREILPQLKKRAITPHDKKKVLPAPAARSSSCSSSPKSLSPFLAGFAARMGLDVDKR